MDSTNWTAETFATWARGEEDAAQKGAIDQSFHGISLTCWMRVLAAARAGGEVSAKEPTGSKRKAAKSSRRTAMKSRSNSHTIEVKIVLSVVAERSPSETLEEIGRG